MILYTPLSERRLLLSSTKSNNYTSSLLPAQLSAFSHTLPPVRNPNQFFNLFSAEHEICGIFLFNFLFAKLINMRDKQIIKQVSFHLKSLAVYNKKWFEQSKK